MDVGIWDLVGGAGMACIEASYLTQIVRLHQRKEASDISLLFPGLNLVGRVLAMVSSFYLGAQVFVLGFLVGCLLRLAFLLQVIWYRYKTEVTREDSGLHATIAMAHILEDPP